MQQLGVSYGVTVIMVLVCLRSVILLGAFIDIFSGI